MTPQDENNELKTKISLTRGRMKELREYCVIDIPTDHLLKSASNKFDNIEKQLQNENSNITTQTFTNITLLCNEVYAIGMVINTNSRYDQKMESLLLLCNTLEKTPIKYQNSATALYLAQFLYDNTRKIFTQEFSSMDQNDLKQEMEKLGNLCDNIKRKNQNNPIQIANLSKQLILTIKANQNPSQVDTLKQEIKNHKLTISEKLYAATFYKFHKILYEYLNHLSMRVFNQGYLNSPPYHLRVNKINKPKFTHNDSGVKLFKKPKLNKQLNKVAKHIDKKRKADSR